MIAAHTGQVIPRTLAVTRRKPFPVTGSGCTAAGMAVTNNTRRAVVIDAMRLR
jgi:hypothetical protein